MPEKTLQGVILDARRKENKTVYPFHEATDKLFPLEEDVDLLFQMPAEKLRSYKAFVLRCGDGRTHGTYIKAAINALLTFANPNYVPVMPERIIYRRKSKEEEEIEIAEKCVSACWVLGVPAFATFKLKEPISQDKLRLILIAGKSKAETFTRTALTLVLGSLFEYGADLAIKAGLVRSEDVDKVTIYPDKTHSPNCVIDGELVEFDKKLTLERGEQKATILIPKELYGL